jgi:hypothetical protein
VLDAHLFDNATTAYSALASSDICPAGYRFQDPSAGGGGGAGNGTVKRVTSEADLVKEYCVEMAGAGGDGGAGIDFATSYVLVVTHVGFTPSSPILSVGTDFWVRIDAGGGCGGANPGSESALYVLPNATQVKTEVCSTSCTCTNPPCEYPP